LQAGQIVGKNKPVKPASHLFIKNDVKLLNKNYIYTNIKKNEIKLYFTFYDAVY